MKTRLLMITGIIIVLVFLIGFTYYITDSTVTTETEQECDMGIQRETYSLDFENVTYRNEYVIKNGCVDGISHNEDMDSLVINFYKTQNGMIQIILPEFLYDLKPKTDHVVLSDGEEITFEQLAPSALLINFTENTRTIEIIDFSQTSEPEIPDSLKIPNEKRDAKLAAGYKLYPGVGWVHPDAQGNLQPIYKYNPDNSGELILDIDSMIQVQKILNKCEYAQKLRTGEIPAQNPDGSYNAITGELRFYNNGSHSIDSNTCDWVNLLDEGILENEN